jgi:hypothetical protein
MIQWSLTLTGNQIAVLKALEHRRFGEAWEGHGNGISHWITGMRPLLREGLIESFQTKDPKTGYNDMSKTGQFITDRGRFILRMIEEDFATFLKASDLPIKKKEKTKAA